MSFSPTSGTDVHAAANGLCGREGSITATQNSDGGGCLLEAQLTCQSRDGERDPLKQTPSNCREHTKVLQTVLTFPNSNPENSHVIVPVSQQTDNIEYFQSAVVSSGTKRIVSNCTHHEDNLKEATRSSNLQWTVHHEENDYVTHGDDRGSSEDERQSLEREQQQGETDDSQELSEVSTTPDTQDEDQRSCEAGLPRPIPESPDSSCSPSHRKSRVNPFNHHLASSNTEPLSSSSCPPQHVMAEVLMHTAPGLGTVLSHDHERVVGRLQDSKSLDGISQVCGGARSKDRQAEGRRATISSALELEGTVSHDGDLTHFVANNLQQKIKMSSRQSLDSDSSVHSRTSQRKPADIPPIDPGVVLDLEKHTQDIAQSVELMMRSLNSTIQNMTALSVGYIQTYRDSVDSLGESVDMSIKGMYTLMARCEELDRSMQPIHFLAKQIHDIKRTLETLEALCK
ncbi:BLOC-1 related complex subunit 6 [Erpetoichthys calabaricus]|uniref:BLOC-1 related complex subunit 6 n=1 Tax=Erpetoichthys calabaricus TaxID=27687 RepID=A0A8C4XEM3_ERPCA|nr:BLOC-1 related complex subunit 6 [Erpetoichthys calabaricus]